MKRIIKHLIIIFTLILSSYSFAQTTYYANASFNGRHCRGDRGVCNITTVNEETNANAKYFFNKDNTITIEFLKDKMSSDEQLKFLNSISLSNVNNTETKVLSIEEELTITNLLNGNSKEQSFILKRGNFPLLDNPNKYILTLNIKE